MLITRRGYITRRGTYVPPRKIKNRGLPGKGPVLIKNPLKHHGLREYGYFHVDNKTVSQRHGALTRAMRVGKVQPVTLIRRLGAIATLTRRTMPRLSSIYRRDQHWLSKIVSARK